MSDEKFEPTVLPATLTVGARVVPCHLPASRTVRMEIVGLSKVNALRAFGAALGQCVPSIDRKLSISLKGCGWDVAEYGAEVIDGLAGQDLPMDQINELGALCWKAILSSLAVTTAEAQEEVPKS